MQDAIRKIQKAFNLATGNGNAEEAQAAMLLAQRLMAKHGLTTSDLKTEENQTVEASRGTVRKSRIQWWEEKLTTIIAENFRCYGFLRRGRLIGFLGLPDDVAIATEVFQFAENAIRYHLAEYLKQVYSPYSPSRKRTNAIKNDYIDGFLKGLSDKFREQVANESLALVLVKHEVVETAYHEAGWKKGKQINRTSAGDQSAMLQGYEDGRKFNNPVGKIID
ncbi:DUF2786 domain-containing protein [Paenibacillus maysiensis]|uniref:DUF2786 domain-containing protein n=1 Tax=Paenibacillus maysiensis TaxID=1155954 RepID=UPI0004712BA5|nr:DUF2786 domain-containing protein [Paenibacillus maysiensis]